MGHPLENSSKEPYSREAPSTFVEPSREVPPTFVEPSKITRVIFDNPVAKPATQEKIESPERRKFLGGIARSGSFVVGAGVVGGMVPGGFAKMTEVLPPSVNVVQEVYDDRNFQFANAIAASKPESMQLAKERITYYNQQIKAIGDEITRLQTELAHASYDSGTQGLIGNELYLLQHTQGVYVERMQFLKDPAGAYARVLDRESAH